jgi:cytochrome c peroxidase
VQPIYSGIEYGAAIQGLFDNFLSNGGSAGCADCHTSAGGMTPTGNLDLDDGVSWANLFNVPSAEDASLTYVVPNHPERSLLFQKINCDTPGVGARMPYLGYPDGTTTLTADQQALIYDWIAEGAPVGTTDGVFRDSFDLRGFTP